MPATATTVPIDLPDRDVIVRALRREELYDVSSVIAGSGTRGTVRYRTFAIEAVDVEGDRLQGAVFAVATDHYHEATLYLGGQVTRLDLVGLTGGPDCVLCGQPLAGRQATPIEGGSLACFPRCGSADRLTAHTDAVAAPVDVTRGAIDVEEAARRQDRADQLDAEEDRAALGRAAEAEADAVDLAGEAPESFGVDRIEGPQADLAGEEPEDDVVHVEMGPRVGRLPEPPRLPEIRRWSIEQGMRVRLARDVERFPHFIARRGVTGTVLQADSEGVCVELDEYLPGAEDWENQVVWSGDDGFEGLADDVVVLSFDVSGLIGGKP